MHSRQGIPFFHGWIVLVGAFFILFIVQGARSVIGVMFKPVIAEMLLSRSALSMAAFVNMAVFAASLTIVGKYYDRYGARRILIISSLLLALGYIGISGVHSLQAFLFFYGFPAALGFGGTSIPLLAALIGKWFTRYRGMALSTAIAGGCLGQFILVPLATQSVSALGWRITFALIGAAVLAINIPLACFLMKEKPAGTGPKSHDAPAAPRSDAGADPHFAAREDLPSLSLRDAMRSASFWLFLVVMFICGGGDYFVITHLIPMVTDAGVPALPAGRMLGLAGVFSFFGVLAAGPAVDRFGNKKPVMVTFLLRAIVFFLVYKYQTLLSYYIFALTFGFTMLVTAPITTTLAVRLYGFAHVGAITGFITTIHHFSGGLWAWLGGVVFDTFGSYRPAFAAFSLLALVALCCATLIKEERHTLGKQPPKNQI